MFNQLLYLVMHIAAGSAQCGPDVTCATGLPVVSASHKQISQILTIVFTTLGALAVLMVVVAGLRFIRGQGNPQEMSKARNTIIYALVGLLLALTAQAIVSLTLSKL